MKMKTRYLFQLSAFILGIVVMFGCVQWEEFTPIDVANAPTVTLTQTSVADSAVTVEITSSMSGYVAAILLAGAENPVPDSAALLSENVVYDEYMYMEAVANEAVSYTFTTVVQDSDYEVMAVGANEDGVVSDVAVLAVASADTYAPVFKSATPGITYITPSLLVGDTITLTFDEPVKLGDGVFTFESFRTGDTQTVPADNINVLGMDVTIIMPYLSEYGDYIFLSWEAGAVTDMVGNEVAEMVSGFDGSPFVGAFWRTVLIDRDYESAAPDMAVDQEPGFDVVLTYVDDLSYVTYYDPDDEAYYPVIEDGDITLVYDDGAGLVLTLPVPVADVSISGADLTIAQSAAPNWPGTVTVNIPTGLFTVGWGNPMVDVAAEWSTVAVML